MPCRDDYPREAEKINGLTINQLAAIACAAVHFIEVRESFSAFMLTQQNHSGMTDKQVRRWWDEHKAQDAKNRERELQEQQREALRQSGLAKLTSAERRVLLGKDHGHT